MPMKSEQQVYRSAYAAFVLHYHWHVSDSFQPKSESERTAPWMVTSMAPFTECLMTFESCQCVLHLVMKVFTPIIHLLLILQVDFAMTVAPHSPTCSS